MVSVSHTVLKRLLSAPPLDLLAEGLTAEERLRVAAAQEFATGLYGGHTTTTGEEAWSHAMGMALIAVSLRLDADARCAALLFAVAEYARGFRSEIEKRCGTTVAQLVEGLRRLNGLKMHSQGEDGAAEADQRAQTETLRKMMLAMVRDIRVVLLRLASRTQTLHYLGSCSPVDASQRAVARETLAIYAPLANRLGVWQLKWELEDLSFRILQAEDYQRIARLLDERRSEREAFINKAQQCLQNELKEAGIAGEVYGRPKHIYSIYSKMRNKKLDFSQLYDIRALRVLVDKVPDCYKVLDIINRLWQPIAKEYDDYITRPKGNNYQSLHTALLAEDGRPLEVQIRTHEMHRHAELGVAAHWRYKEGGVQHSAYDEKIALLRSLLSWRDEVADAADWQEQLRRAALDDTIYALTPQGRVIDLPQGATPVDFAYQLHTEVGHHCRGAKVDGQLVPLNTVLSNGQTVEISTVKIGGPSRDWLTQPGYVVSNRARTKIRQYFSQLEAEDLLQRGRNAVLRELQREGQTQANIDELATRLGMKNADAMFAAFARGELGPRLLHSALHPLEEEMAEPECSPELIVRRSRSEHSSDLVLINGIGKLMTSLGRCCKPAPPDAICGFITLGRGVSVHRAKCADFLRLQTAHPERVVEAQWGQAGEDNLPRVFPVDVEVMAMDRTGLLRDISEALAREKINVTAVSTSSKSGSVRLRFTLEIGEIANLRRVFTLVQEVQGVTSVQRR